jgi:hypothetical protein
METGKKENVTVSVVDHPLGITAGCVKCRTVLKSGRFAIGVLIDPHKYLVGENPPIMCCGEEKKVPLLFNDLGEADAARMRTMQTLDADGTTANLRLLEAAVFTSDAKH